MPELRIHDAEVCFNDALQLLDNNLFTIDQIKDLIKNSKEKVIFSEYSSPIYFANLALWSHNQCQHPNNQLKISMSLSVSSVSFKVLEKASNHDLEPDAPE